MPDPSNAGDRAKAYRLRKVKKLPPVDALWLAEYEEKKRNADGGAARSKNFGASRSGRRVKIDVEEHAEAVGEGNAAVAAASAALVAKEEGRRLDALTIESVGALKEAVAVYRDVCLTLKERTEVLEATHIAMLDAVRGHYLSRTESEAALINLQNAQNKDDDPAKGLLEMIIAKHLGLPGGAAAMPGHTNGAASKRRPSS